MRKLRLKKEPFFKERDEDERRAFESEVAALPEETPVVYIDEAGVQQEMKRTHGRSKRGVKLFVETSGKRTKKLNTIAGYIPTRKTSSKIIHLCFSIPCHVRL